MSLVFTFLLGSICVDPALSVQTLAPPAFYTLALMKGRGYSTHPSGLAHTFNPSVSFPSSSISPFAADSTRSPFTIQQKPRATLARVDASKSEAHSDGVNDDGAADEGDNSKKNKTSTSPPDNLRFETVVTFVGAPTRGLRDRSRGQMHPIGSEMQTAMWLQDNHIDVAYYAPSESAGLTLTNLLDNVSRVRELNGLPRHTPRIVRLDGLAELGQYQRDFPDDKGGGQQTNGSASRYSNVRLSNGQTDSHDSLIVPNGPHDETVFDFIERLDDALMNIIGREVQEAKLVRTIVSTTDGGTASTTEGTEAGREFGDGPGPDGRPEKSTDHSEIKDDTARHGKLYRGTALPRRHRTHVVIVANHSVLISLMRRLLILGGWPSKSARWLLETYQPSRARLAELIQLEIGDVDQLPLEDKALSTKRLARERKNLKISAWAWPWS